MNINNNKFSYYLNQLIKNINEFEKEYFELYGAYKNFSFYWHDGYSDSFFTLIENEEKEVCLFVDDMKVISSVLKNICKKYSKYGNKIEINSDIKEDVLNYFGEIKQNYENIEKKMDNYTIKNMIIPFDVSSKYDDIKKKVVDSKVEISEFKNRYRKVYKEIMETENQAYLNIKKNDIIKINDRDFINLEKTETILNNIGFFAGYDKQLKLINSLRNEEYNYHKRIEDNFYKILLYYDSKISKQLKNDIVLIENNFKTLRQNHLNSVEFLNLQIERNKEAVIKTKIDLKNIGEING